MASDHANLLAFCRARESEHAGKPGHEALASRWHGAVWVLEQLEKGTDVKVQSGQGEGDKEGKGVGA